MDSYSVKTDDRLRLLHIVLSGYWSQATFDAFALDYEKALMQMYKSGGLDLALVEGREFAVQARDVSEQFGKLIARHITYAARRTATVVPAHLNKLQAERTGGELAAAYFIDMEEALVWLFGTGDALAAGRAALSSSADAG